MTQGNRTLVVEQLPERLNAKERREFLRQIKNCMSHDRPHVVLDLSHVRQLDSSLIHILLCCLEEAIKRRGDVKLAGVVPEAKQMLQISGADHIFEIHATCEDAVKSFGLPSLASVRNNRYTAA